MAKLKSIQRFAIAVGPYIIKALAKTWRITTLDYHHWGDRRKKGEVTIVALWHGEMLPLLYQHRNQGVAILISEHRDGELIARIAEKLGMKTVRGSTSRGAARALISMNTSLSNGDDVAITPDGPRGPFHSVAPGAMIVSFRSGAPIVPLSAHADRAWVLKSWDKFIIPKPFAKVVIAYGDPVVVEAEDSRAAAENTELLDSAMQMASEKASARLAR